MMFPFSILGMIFRRPAVFTGVCAIVFLLSHGPAIAQDKVVQPQETTELAALAYQANIAAGHEAQAVSLPPLSSVYPAAIAAHNEDPPSNPQQEAKTEKLVTNLSSDTALPDALTDIAAHIEDPPSNPQQEPKTEKLVTNLSSDTALPDALTDVAAHNEDPPSNPQQEPKTEKLVTNLSHDTALPDALTDVAAHNEDPPSNPQQEPKTEKLVTNLFYDTALRDALTDIAAQTGEIIVPDVSVQGIVTCELKEVPLEEALGIVLSAGNYVFQRMDGYILVGASDVDGPSFSKLSETKQIMLNYLKSENAVKMLSDSMKKFAKPDKDTNTICVTAPPVLLKRIVNDLKLLDQPPRQILLDTKIVAIERGDFLNMGIQWGWPKVAAGIFSDFEQHGQLAPKGSPSWPWGIEIGYTPDKEFTNALILTLNLLTQNDEATILASPQVMAQHGREAEIKVTTEEYFEILTRGYYSQSELEKIEAGTILKITPWVGENDQITLDMSVEVSDVVARGQGNLPVVTRRSSQSTVRIQNGGTAAVAGLLDNRTRFYLDRVPFLAKLPLLGYLFRSERKLEASKQVAIFVMARLIAEEPPNYTNIALKKQEIKPVGEEFKIDLIKSLEHIPKGGQ